MLQILINLAMTRARLREAISTARACGNNEYCKYDYLELEIIDKRIDSLVKVLNPRIVEKAREMTNAPI